MTKNIAGNHKAVIIVGAGPAGLALGYELQQRGIDFQIFEREQIGWAWRNHYERLRLHTLKHVSHLPGLAMPDDYPDFPRRTQVVAYLQQYAEHFRLPIQCNTQVTKADWDGQQWQITTSHGAYSASVLVMATGIWSTPVTPNIAGLADFQGRVLHAHEYYNAMPFIGQRVLVVGVGNTGAEIAVELGQSGSDTTLWVRSGVTMVARPRSAWAMRIGSWLFRHLPRHYSNWLLAHTRHSFAELGLPQRPVEPIDAYPVVGFDLVEAVRDGQVTIINDLVHITATGIQQPDGSERPFDTIILATGYRPTVQAVAPYFDFDQRGWPLLDRGRALRYDCLYGLGFTYPTTEGWLQAIGRAAKDVANQIVNQPCANGQPNRPTHQAEPDRAVDAKVQ